MELVDGESQRYRTGHSEPEATMTDVMPVTT
jgi:hypothetical protein